MEIKNLAEEDFVSVLEMAEKTYGKNYATLDSLDDVLRKSIKDSLNCSFVAYDTANRLVGFRLTLAPGQWEIDKWYSPDKWGVAKNKVCLFKCNTIRSDLRGRGLGSQLLKKSIEVVVKQGALAGVTHTWMQSPGNGAYNYFIKSGGKELAIYPDRWSEDYHTDGYICSIDGPECHCDGAEMILYFKECMNVSSVS